MAVIGRGKKLVDVIYVQCESCGAEHFDIEVKLLKRKNKLIRIRKSEKLVYEFKCPCCSHTNKLDQSEIPVETRNNS